MDDQCNQRVYTTLWKAFQLQIDSINKARSASRRRWAGHMTTYWLPSYDGRGSLIYIGQHTWTQQFPRHVPGVSFYACDDWVLR